MPSVEEKPIIMVVDDERDFLDLTRAFLEKHGFHVDARTRAPSWRELRRIDPALVLMDVALDGENGAEVCHAIKKHPHLGRLAVILISGQGEDRLRKEVDWCRADGFLTKPISSGLLMQLADHYTKLHARNGGLHGAHLGPNPPENATEAEARSNRGTDNVRTASANGKAV